MTADAVASRPIVGAGLRIAIAHEWHDSPGVAENVVRGLPAIHSDADLRSLWCLSPAREEMEVEAQSAWLARTPLAGHKIAALPLEPLAWWMLPRRDFDLRNTSRSTFAHHARVRGRTGPVARHVNTPGRCVCTPGGDGHGASRAAAAPRSATSLAFGTHEDFGIVPVEAMICGTRVVGHAVGGFLGVGVRRDSGLNRGAIPLAAGRFSTATIRGAFKAWTSAVLDHA